MDSDIKESRIAGENIIELVERNLGRWKPNAVFILDVNFRIWSKKGEISDGILEYYRKFPFSEMHIGDALHNENTFMMKVTQKMAVLIGMKTPQLARISAINLRWRISTLSPFHELDKKVEEEKSEHELLEPVRVSKKLLETQDPRYQAVYAIDEVEKREKDSFILDKTILRIICEAETISLSQIRQRIASFEELLGERIDLTQIRSICDRYVREGLIKQL